MQEVPSPRVGMAKVPVPQLASEDETAAEMLALLTAVPLWLTTMSRGVSAITGVAWPPGVRVTAAPSVVAPASVVPAGELSVPHEPATTW
jgi:hypothetical protein